MFCKSCGLEIPANALYCNWCGVYQPRHNKKKTTVPKPALMPSGRWRIQLRKEGINIVADSQEECIEEAIAARRKWEADEAAGLHAEAEKCMTLGEAIDNYIAAKEPVLSVSTIYGYKVARADRLMNWIDTPANLIDTQQLVNDEAARGMAPKTISNTWGLCASALRYAKIPYDVPALPRKTPTERKWLDYDQIQTFLKAAEGEGCEIAALLALHSLRASELRGLRLSDVDLKANVIHIRGAMLRTIDNSWVRTDLNKNDTSRRDVPIIIPRLKERLTKVDKTSSYVIGDTHANLYREINRVCEKAGLPKVGVHGLRHSFASLAYHLGWKKLSTMQIGGWKNSKVLDAVYTHNADLEHDVEKMREYFRE